MADSKLLGLSGLEGGPLSISAGGFRRSLRSQCSLKKIARKY